MAASYAHRWFSNFGPVAQSLEQRLKARIGRPVQMIANGTIAITAALLALGRKGPVILPSFTFPATMMAVLEAGCTPVLADVDPVSWEMGPDQVAAVLPLLSCAPVAVLGVRPFGLCRDQAALEHWCQERNVPFIIDAAAALGGVLSDGRPVGGQGAMETFSLHATKVFAIGEGGAIAYMPQWQTPLREVLNFGMHDGTPTRMGINGKLSEFAAAVGLAQDDVFDEHLRVRRTVAERYRRFFMEYWSDWTPPWNPGSPPWQAYPVLAPTPEVLQRALQATTTRGIQLRRYYHPALHQSPFGAPYAPRPLPVSADLSARMLCFPVYSDMSREDHFKIMDVLKSIT